MSYLGKCTFLKSAAHYSQIPQNPQKRIAFWGRSNVGKSSLLNALCGEKIAKVSKTPGRTQLINLFHITEPEAMICDLPGYGFAKLSHGQLKEIAVMLEGFFSQASHVDLLCLLIDSRHGLTKTDQEILPILKNLGCPLFVILTKADKNSKNINKKMIFQVQKDLAEHLLCPPIFLASNLSKDSTILFKQLAQAIKNI
jgi:GTP-binding protein